MVQVRADAGGLVLQQLLYGDEVRSLSAINIEVPEVPPAELHPAEQLIEQYRVDGYDAAAYRDAGKESVLAPIDQKIAKKNQRRRPNAARGR